MKKSLNLLKQKNLALEKKLREKESLLRKYQQALKDSNLRIKKATKDLKNSLSLVREIHKNLLPVRLPHIPGFELSHKFLPTEKGVSGDFFDVVKIKDSMSFGILFSSCNTYAVTSLLVSSFFKFSRDIKNYKTAKDFLDFAVQKLSSSLSKKEKIHLFYGIISRNSFELDYFLVGDIFVGHKSPEKDFYVLPPCSPRLCATNKLKSGKLKLKAKDFLLFCSPGISQRANAKGESFGKENIIKSASQNLSGDVLEMRQNVLFACNEFAKGKASLRDCTALTVKVTGGVLKIQNS